MCEYSEYAEFVRAEQEVSAALRKDVRETVEAMRATQLAFAELRKAMRDCGMLPREDRP